MDGKNNDSNGEFEIVDSGPAAPAIESPGQAQVASVPSAEPAQVSAPTSFPPPPLPNPYSVRAGVQPPAPLPPPVQTLPNMMMPVAPEIQAPVSGQPASVLTQPTSSSFDIPFEAVPLSTPTGDGPQQGGMWGWFQGVPGGGILTSLAEKAKGVPGGGILTSLAEKAKVSTTPTGDGPQQGGMWGWFQGVPGGGILTSLAEKAKSQVENVVTTLDPQMKDFLNVSGQIEIVVASDKEPKIVGVKEGFMREFAHVVARGLGSPSMGSSLPAQPVGFESAMKAAEQRIQSLRESRLAPPGLPIVAVEGFLMEFSPNNWHELALLALEDQAHGTKLHVLSQATPVPASVVQTLKEQTKDPTSGFDVTIGEAMGTHLGVPHTEWHQRATGKRRNDVIAFAASSLAHLYRNERAAV